MFKNYRLATAKTYINKLAIATCDWCLILGRMFNNLFFKTFDYNWSRSVYINESY